MSTDTIEAIPDLWPEIAGAKAPNPLLILRKQAADLGRKTSQIIEGEVVTTAAPGRVDHTLYLLVPVLDDYRYPLLVVQQDPAEPYPLHIVDYRTHRDQTCNSQSDFVEALRGVLNSDSTKKALQALLATATSTGHDIA